MAELQADHLIVIGAQTNNCIRSTVYSALEKGYDVTLIADAHTTSDDEWNGKALSAENDTFEQLYLEAKGKNKVLRMVAKLEDGKASISLEKISDTHPFSQLSGSDNMIVFTTSRYKERPLVIRGPGAGASHMGRGQALSLALLCG